MAAQGPRLDFRQPAQRTFLHLLLNTLTVSVMNFTVWFADTKVTRWEGDEMPQSVLELNRSASAKALPSNAPGEKSVWDRFLDVFRK